MKKTTTISAVLTSTRLVLQFDPKKAANIQTDTFNQTIVICFTENSTPRHQFNFRTGGKWDGLHYKYAKGIRTSVYYTTTRYTCGRLLEKEDKNMRHLDTWKILLGTVLGDQNKYIQFRSEVGGISSNKVPRVGRLKLRPLRRLNRDKNIHAPYGNVQLLA